jgi:hypothetical protein
VPGTLLFALVPDGWSLQHFLDGVLPKLVQARELLAHPSVTARPARSPPSRLPCIVRAVHRCSPSMLGRLVGSEPACHRRVLRQAALPPPGPTASAAWGLWG